ncbi:MAG: PA2169 family four-helix-bundle protein [Saprospiraceae bacterium]|nr:PA2169 family four-helix-bundle protein [Saprospiraceae bacterium]
MKTEQTIDVLNTLVTINNDRIEGYETASNETEEQDLKSIFARFAQTSHACRQALAHEVTRLGGTPSEGTRTSGKIFRVWMDVKAAVTGKDRKGILNSCEYGEDMAVDTYDTVLKENQDDITSEQQTMLLDQRELIKADHDEVKAMRDVLANA